VVKFSWKMLCPAFIMFPGLGFGLSPLSPAIIFFPVYFVISVLQKTTKIIALWAGLILILGVFGLYINAGDSLTDFMRLVYFVFMFLFFLQYVKMVDDVSSRRLVYFFLAVVFLDRLFSIIMYAPSLSFYDLKKSFLFADTNFISYLAGSALLFKNPREFFLDKIYFLLFIIVVLGLSRNVWLSIIIAYLPVLVFLFLFILVVFVAFGISKSLLDYLYGYDGSLDTKIAMIEKFSDFVSTGVTDLFFGLGRVGVSDFQSEHSIAYVGHSFWGNSMQSGLLLNLAILSVFLLARSTREKRFLVYTYTSAFLGLMPISVYPLSVLMFFLSRTLRGKSPIKAPC